jgi:hypothetical protein
MAESAMNRLILVLWPSFLAAGVAEIVFFTLIDPQELYLLGEPVHFSSIATYSLGFLGFWLICALSSFATLFFQRPGSEINHHS